MLSPKIYPVLISILIILTVAFLRERSKTFAVLAGTMPINLPLTLWIVFGNNDANSTAITSFVRSLLVGLFATMLWMVVVWLVVRAGWGLLSAILTGYAAWGALVALLIVFGYLSVASR